MVNKERNSVKPNALVYCSPVPWRSFEQRPHKLVRWFHARTGGDVMWVDPYPTRLPSCDDFRSRAMPVHAHDRVVPDWLKVLSPFSLPIEPLPLSYFLNQIFWGSLLSKVKHFASERAVLVGVGKPSFLDEKILSLLAGNASFYDAMDDFPAFYRGFSSVSMAGRERKLVSLVDTVCVSSTELYKRWCKTAARIKLVPNGLDAGLLPSAAGKRAVFSSNQSVFGYVGTIGSWFDWPWVLELALRRPTDKIKLVGPLHTPVPEGLPGNIELSPACSHQEALKTMSYFDVGIIPFKNNELTSSVDPIKYYEYIALGVPVLSTNFGEMSIRRNNQGVFITDDASDIVTMAESALRVRFTKDYLDNFVQVNDWNYRFDAAEVL